MEKHNLFKRGANKISAFIVRNINVAVLVCFFVVAFSGTVYASPADTLWSTISGLIGTWVTRLGMVIMFAGAVMFALGWKSDDAEGKSRGIGTIISGAIVTAVAALTPTFFA